MPKHDSVLVTGGAGFIGSHVVDLLLQNGHNVTIVDNLDPQVHGVERRIPLHLEKNSSIVIEDVRNKEQFAKILKNADAVIHLAASVGVGQSMYQFESYIDSYSIGPAFIIQFHVYCYL